MPAEGRPDDSLFRQLADDADGLHSAHTAGQQVGAQEVLGQLVLGVAIACFLDGERGQPLHVGARRSGHALDNGVDLLLVVVAYFCQAA